MGLFTGLAIGAAAVGVGLQVKGMSDAKKAADAQSRAQADITASEREQEAVRQKAVRLDARRRQLETVRNIQRARAQALTTANAQGARLGSSLQAGYSQIGGAGRTESLGILQNRDLGREMYMANQDLSTGRLAYAQAGTRLITAQGYSSLGGSLVGAAGTFGNVMNSAYSMATTRTAQMGGLSSLGGGSYIFGPNSGSSAGYMGRIY